MSPSVEAALEASTKQKLCRPGQGLDDHADAGRSRPPVGASWPLSVIAVLGLGVLRRASATRWVEVCRFSRAVALWLGGQEPCARVKERPWLALFS